MRMSAASASYQSRAREETLKASLVGMPSIKTALDAGTWQPARTAERLAFFEKTYEAALSEVWDGVYDHFVDVCKRGPCVPSRQIRVNVSRERRPFAEIVKAKASTCPRYIQQWIQLEVCPRIFRHMAIEMKDFLKDAYEDGRTRWFEILDPWHEHCAHWHYRFERFNSAFDDLPPPTVPIARRLGGRV